MSGSSLIEIWIEFLNSSLEISSENGMLLFQPSYLTFGL